MHIHMHVYKNTSISVSIVIFSAGINDLFPVLTAVVNVSDKWQMLGLALGLKQQPTLDRIETDNGTSTLRKNEMMKEWLNGHGHTPSWAELAKALREKIVGHGSIADIIEKEKLNKQ